MDESIEAQVSTSRSDDVANGRVEDRNAAFEERDDGTDFSSKIDSRGGFPKVNIVVEMVNETNRMAVGIVPIVIELEDQ